MSCALFISLDEGQVVAERVAERVGISVIERLPIRGVRLVCNSSEGAGTMTRTLKGHFTSGEVVRERHRPTKPLW